MSEVSTETAPVLGLEQMQKMLATMKPNTGINLAATMLVMEAGEEERVIFMGMSQIAKFNKPDELTDSVDFLTADGMKKSADKVLVSTFRGKKSPSAYLLVCKGKTQGNSGEYREFDIHPLEA